MSHATESPCAPAATPEPLSILIVEADDLARSLLARALLRRFPGALVQQCAQSDTAAFAAGLPHLTALLVGAPRRGGRELVAQLRAANAHVPIVVLATELAASEATEAGGTCVMDAQQWIRVPDVVATIARLRVRHEDSAEVEFRTG